MSVSIIIPTYKGSEHIKRTIESLLQQTYQDISIIVVDDNGKDSDEQKKTYAVLKDYINQNKLEYYPLDMNHGGSFARNYGAERTQSKYLMFIDDDDTVSPNKIEIQVDILDKTDDKSAFVYCSTRVFDSEGLSNIIIAKKQGSILYDYLMGRVYIGTGTVLIKKAVWEKMNGYDVSFSRHQDWEFYTRILNCYTCCISPSVYFDRRIIDRNNPTNISVAEKNMDHFIDFLKSYTLQLSKQQLKRVICRNNAKIALKYLRSGDLKEFVRVEKKYGNLLYALTECAIFGFIYLKNRVIGKKS